jgi:hypothetical protein
MITGFSIRHIDGLQNTTALYIIKSLGRKNASRSREHGIFRWAAVPQFSAGVMMNQIGLRAICSERSVLAWKRKIVW